MDDYYNINILKCSKNEYIQEFLDIVMQITWFLLFIQWELKQGHYSYNETQNKDTIPTIKPKKGHYSYNET